MSRSVFRILLFILIGYGGVLLLAGLLQRRLIYQPMKAGIGELMKMAESKGLQPWRDTEGTIIGWKTADLPDQESTIAVLAMHGNSGHALHRDYVSDGFLNQRAHEGPFQVFLFEYPGYGHREGKPTDETIKQAAEEAFNYLADQNFEQILLFGESLGSGAASYLAAQFPDEADGLILVSPFSSLKDVAVERYFLYPADMILTESFDNVEMLKKYDRPVVFLYAEDDFIIPNSFTKKLHASYDGPKIILSQPDRGHNSINYSQSAEWWQQAFDFMMK